MACGCVIISEKLPIQTVIDLGMKDAIIEVESPKELREKLIYLQNNPEVLKQYKEKTKDVISNNTWHDRAKIIKNKFKEICEK